MKKMNFIKIGFVLLMFLILTTRLNAQNSCDSAMIFNNSNIDSTILYSDSGNEFWLKFTAVYKNYTFEISKPDQTPYAGLLYYQLYTGRCDSLELISVDSSNFIAINLDTTKDYFLVVNKSDTNFSYFNLKIGIDTNDYSSYKYWVADSCPPLNCENIMNPEFYADAGYDDLSPFAFSSDQGQVCGWLSLCLHPNLKTISPYQPNVWMWSEIHQSTIYGEAIQQQLVNTISNSVNYSLSFDWKSLPGITNSLDELNIYLVNPAYVNLTPDYYDLLGLHNNSQTGLRDILEDAVSNSNGLKIGGTSNTHLTNLLSTSTWVSTTINFANVDPSWNLLVVFPYDDDAGGSSILIDNFQITTIYDPIITGNNNTCDTNAVYSISNAQAGYTYEWTIGDNSYSSSFPQTGSTISVVWEPLWSYNAVSTWIYVTATDTITGCSVVDSLRIWKCCKKNIQTTVYNDETITNSSVFNGTPDPPYFNGTITINANINVASISHIFMGPEAKFIVNPPYTFTVTTSKIEAGCPYMWNGIYVTDSNAKVVIENKSTVEEAFNAIYSDNGGKFELKDSKFYNNDTSVHVTNNYYGAGGPWYPHKGIIYGCEFNILGSGMIAPYTNIKPRLGVYLNNVYNLYIGDSTQGRNSFMNLFCGIGSFYSSVNVYNNYFYFINTPNNCSSPAGDYYNLNCETAIHSAAIYQDLYHNSSQLVCGAGNNSLNTFDTCRYAIYTYNTLTKVDHAKITRTGVGVYCREAKTYSFVKNSSVTNKISAGIEFVNTLALTRGYTIYNDTVLDPLMGIYLLNVTSNPNSPALQTTVSNNYITNVMPKPMYGLDFEVCDYVDAFCNQVSRTSLPSQVYRLTIRGIQINHSVSAQLHANTSTSLGVSIKGRGSLLGTQFKCNTSDGSYYGFYFDASGTAQTALSDQGTLSSPNDNMWYNDVTNYYRIDGTYNNPNTISWFYRNPYPNQYGPNEPVSLSYYIYLTQAQNPVAVNCQSCTNDQMMAGNSNSPSSESGSVLAPTINNDELDAIINESNNYQELDESFKYFEKQYAYKKLTANQQLLNTIQSNYLLQLRNSNIGSFEQIYREIENGNISNADALNSQISPVNIIEKNRKWVNGVYFDFIIPQKAIPQNIIADLETLASSSPFINGDAVYSARAIVGFTEEEPAETNNKNLEAYPTNTISENNNIEIKVYPNPAKEFISIDIIGNTDKPLNFVLTNMLGIKVMEKTIDAAPTTYKLDVHQLKQGIYIYEAIYKNNGVSIKKGRIVIEN